jgi:hypothetical protein
MRRPTHAVTAIAVASILAAAQLALAGGATAAQANGEGASSAGRISQLAARIKSIPIDMVRVTPTLGEERAMQRARSAMIALRSQIAASLPADATPTAVAARAELIKLDDEWVRQFGDGVARDRLDAQGQARDFCRLDHYTQARTTLADHLIRFDGIAKRLSSQSGVQIAHISGVYIAPRERLDADRNGAAGLCALVSVNTELPVLHAATKANNRAAYLAVTTATTKTMGATLAFLAKRRPRVGSPYLATWRAAVAFATAERTWQRALIERAKTGRVTHLAAAQHAEKVLPRLQASLVTAMQIAELLPPSPTAPTSAPKA